MSQEKPKNLSRRAAMLALSSAAASAGLLYFVDGKPETEEKFIERFVHPLSTFEFSKKKDKSKERGSRNLNSKLSSEELDDLTWNLINETRDSESDEGKIATILSVINRMIHPNDAPTATGVIYRDAQYSWVGEKTFPVPNSNRNDKAYIAFLKSPLLARNRRLTIPPRENILRNRRLLQNITKNGNATIEEIRDNILKMLAAKGFVLPKTPILFYKRYDLPHNSTWSEIERRVRSRNEVPVRIGDHVFYSGNRF